MSDVRLFLAKTKVVIRRHYPKFLFFILGNLATLVIIGSMIELQHTNTAMPYRKGAITIKWLPPTVTHYSQAIERQANKYNIDAQFVAIIMTLESGGYTKADSGVAKGLMQVTDPTGTDIAKMYLKKPVRSYDLFDPQTSIEFGVAYIAHLRDTLCDYTDGPSWDRCAEVIATGYNGGPGAAIKLIKGNGIQANETLIYSRNAFNMWREKSASKSPTFDRWQAAGGQRLIDAAKKEQK